MQQFRTPPATDEIEIFVDAAGVIRRTSFSLMHITRLERRGLFPRRVKLGQARVGWSLTQVLQWMQDKSDRREDQPQVLITAKDRFIRAAELKNIVIYSPEYLRTLEAQGTFPKRIRIGDSAVAWLLSEVKAWREERFKDIYVQNDPRHHSIEQPS